MSLQPKEIAIKDMQGVERTYVLHLIPYASGGREVCSQFLPTAMPKVGDYARNEELMLKMMAHVGVKIGDKIIMLETKDLINNHVPDFQTGARIEKEMLEYNFGFFDAGKIQEFQNAMAMKFRQLILPTLTQLRDALLPKDSQH